MRVWDNEREREKFENQLTKETSKIYVKIKFGKQKQNKWENWERNHKRKEYRNGKENSEMLQKNWLCLIYHSELRDF